MPRDYHHGWKEEDSLFYETVEDPSSPSWSFVVNASSGWMELAVRRSAPDVTSAFSPDVLVVAVRGASALRVRVHPSGQCHMFQACMVLVAASYSHDIAQGEVSPTAKRFFENQRLFLQTQKRPMRPTCQAVQSTTICALVWMIQIEVKMRISKYYHKKLSLRPPSSWLNIHSLLVYRP